jgi:UDP-N-acetylglucosamine 4-epimerase
MRYQELQATLRNTRRTWLVTGAAGFIGSNLLETLLQLEQRVVCLDNFSTGKWENLNEVCGRVGRRRWSRATVVEGDICDLEMCRRVCEGVDFVLHEAALGSVPRSLADPIRTHASNVSGFLNVLMAAREARVGRLVYASSSSVYGDHPALPKQEENIGHPLSPYAATKVMDELYAWVFQQAFGLECIGLRYFNVFGPRQDPQGAYAAVIPRWIAAMLKGEPVEIYGDGNTSRDFSFIDNIVQANLLAATTSDPSAVNQVFNIAVGETTTLNQLFALIRASVHRLDPALPEPVAICREFRPADVRHSHAAIEKARDVLGYVPTHTVQTGLESTVEWYLRKVRPARVRERGGRHPVRLPTGVAAER